MRGRLIFESGVYSVLILSILFVFSGCERKVQDSESIVKVHLVSQPESLHPYEHISKTAAHIVKHIYQPLVDVDYRSAQMVPVLAASLPEILPFNDTSQYLIFDIRKEAAWEDGISVTARDVEFSIKVILNSLHKKSVRSISTDYLLGFERSETDNKKCSILVHSSHMGSLESLTSLYILPKHILDPEGFSDNSSITMLKTKNAKPLNFNFGKDFGSSKGANRLIGSAPYKVLSWENKKEITLVAKRNWWGKETEHNHYFECGVERIKYVIQKDVDLALSALLLGQLDVMVLAGAEKISDLEMSQVFLNEFEVYSPIKHCYTYLGFHLKDEVLKQKIVREAMDLAIDKDRMIDKILGGYGSRIIGPLHPLNTFYNKSIKEESFNVQRANALLDEEGWLDLDGDGYRSKILGGKLTDLSFKLSFAKNNINRKLGEYIKEAFNTIGIKILLQELELNSFLALNKVHDFEILLNSVHTNPVYFDPKYRWHTEAYFNGGLNWTGFGSPYTDGLIDEICSSSSKRMTQELLNEFQEILQERKPCSFLFAPQYKLIISKKIMSPNVSSIGLGFWESSMVSQ